MGARQSLEACLAVLEASPTPDARKRVRAFAQSVERWLRVEATEVPAARKDLVAAQAMSTSTQ